MSRRLPRPAARSASASVTREVPPVNTTMPSALRSSTISCFGNRHRKARKPRTTPMAPRTMSLTTNDLMRRRLTADLRLSIAAPVLRAVIRSVCADWHLTHCESWSQIQQAIDRVCDRSVDHLQSAIDGAARGQRRHQSHEYYLQEDRQI